MRQLRLNRFLRRTAVPTTTASRRAGAPQQIAPQRQMMATFAVFGLALGVVLGTLLALPLSPAAGIVRGEPSPVRINAPRTLKYQSDVLTQQAQEQAASDPSNIVTQVDPSIPGQQRDALSRTLDTITQIRDDEALNDQQRFDALIALQTVPISPTVAMELAQLPDERWQIVADASRQLYDERWLNRPGGLSEADVRAIRERELPYLQISPSLTSDERRLVAYFVGTFLKPNRTINEEATALQREADRRAVEPVTVTIVKGENIVREGDIVTEETYEALTKLGLVFGVGGRAALAQQFLVGMLTAWLFASYLYRYQSFLWRNRRGLAVIGTAMAVMVLAGRLSVPSWDVAPYAFPLAAMAIVLTVLFDGRIGLMSALVIAPLIGLQTEQSIGLTLTLALGSAAGVFVAQRALRSISFVWVGLAVAAMTVLGALAFWLDFNGSARDTLMIPLFGLANGVGASILALGTYHVLGRLANVVTPFQLMELAHPNHPLLHRLMREAPGTYHHSMVVSNLAEVAAENIGADPLLARVGAYYHDIGKMLRPYFFTDNQHERLNVHDDLDPKTSASIIIDHVREGAKLAREHALPQQVIDFIQEHHGTNLVSYFYQRALQVDGDADIEDFRYPGPRPQTREAGIMMLADGVEATVRAKSQSGSLRPMRPNENGTAERGHQSIADVVEQIVSERVRNGQLDECPLTLRDIAIIKESFVQTLQGIYHPRVEYPQAQA